MMSTTVCMAVPPVVTHRGNGAYLWIFINWALGLRSNGHRVIWLEDARGSSSKMSPGERTAAVDDLRARLRPFGLDTDFVLARCDGRIEFEMPDMPEFDPAETVLLDFVYQSSPEFVDQFGRSALMDIDPGLLQVWISRGEIEVARHDFNFTIGETVGTSQAGFSDCGLTWLHTPPPVALAEWPISPCPEEAAFTAVTGWWDEWMELGGEVFSNEKRTAFLEFITLPGKVPTPMELAIIIDDLTGRTDVPLLESHGWRVREARDVCVSPEALRSFVQRARGEFTCMRPSSPRLNSTWMEDRTLCFLASGKPAIVQRTAPSRYEFEDGGLIRFETLEEAEQAIRRVAADYDHHCRQARRIAEEHFDARAVAGRLMRRIME